MRFGSWKMRDRMQDRILGRSHRQRIFARIHARNLWGDPESRSGSGSSAAMTEALRRGLPALFKRQGVRVLLDAPCGDFLWMKGLAGGLDRYIGVDIVPDLVARNTEAYGRGNVSFLCADISVDPLPSADMILCRDCLIHLPLRTLLGVLRNFRACGARHLLLTSDDAAGPYRDIPIGSFRSIDFMRAPFSFPEPLERIREDGSESRQLCLWDLRTLPLPG